MEMLDEVLSVIERSSSKKSPPAKKRRWREIEALKEKHRLKKELQSIDCTLDPQLDDLDF
ncbi:DUF3545 family protein [Algicola sagamiensis]|uniref:DUF3545 family protein n=1 Tax=Algicola sagamiensis TaxID=163869 RepID=UPI00037324C9|nr:DUF3545 family protein [Algicola sagamiensis]